MCEALYLANTKSSALLNFKEESVKQNQAKGKKQLPATIGYFWNASLFFHINILIPRSSMISVERMRPYAIFLKWAMHLQTNVSYNSCYWRLIWKRSLSSRVNTQQFTPRDLGLNCYSKTRKNKCGSLHPSQHKLFIITDPSEIECSSQHSSGRKRLSLE